MPTFGEHEGDKRPDQRAAMQDELVALLAAAQADDLTPEQFRERIELIHARHLGGDIDAPEFVNSRRDAVAAYDEFTSGRDRHHQLELVSRALQIRSPRERGNADLDPRG
jgi:hypothetical protein